MKKENKKLAQERRAQERKKAQKKAAVVKQLKFWVPLVATVVVVAVLVWAIATSGSSSSSSDDSSTTTESTATDSSTTDSSTTESSATDSSDTDSTTTEDSTATTLDTTEGLEAKDGDTVNIDYTGYLDGEAFDGGSTNGAGADLELGSDTYIDGFEDGIVGHKVGETFDLNLTFPENYGNSDLAGKDVVFTVTLNGIYQQ